MFKKSEKLNIVKKNIKGLWNHEAYVKKYKNVIKFWSHDGEFSYVPDRDAPQIHPSKICTNS